MTRFITAIAIVGTLLGACASGTKYVHAETGDPVLTAGASHAGTLDSTKPASLLSLRLAPLPPPGEVHEDYDEYVAWARIGDTTQRLGPVAYDPDSRAGHLSVLTSLEEFELLVSAESDDDVDRPSSSVVARRLIST